MDWEDNIGISAPLYDIIDEIFGLQSRGFVRRQVGLSSVAKIFESCGKAAGTHFVSASGHSIAVMLPWCRGLG